jgi:hypothetical protein
MGSGNDHQTVIPDVALAVSEEASGQAACVVESVHGGKVYARCGAVSHKELLKKQLGGSKSWLGGHWEIPFDDDPQMARILMALRDAGFAFQGSSGDWSPAGYFDYFREQGLVTGAFFEISFPDPSRPPTLRKR